MSEKKFVVKEVVEIKDGMHKGLIKDVVYDEDREFDYIDIFVELTDITMPETKEHPVIKTGFPANLSSKSTFGKFLIAAGVKIKPGMEMTVVDFKKELIDRKVSFQTMHDGDYSNIINKTFIFE